MMTKIKGPAPNACQSCPYRQDVPSGVWSAEEYAKLREYDNETWLQPHAVFQCHQTGPQDRAARLCAGWVGCHGQELIALRLGIASGTLDPSVMAYETDVPLFASGADAAEHGEADIDCPGEEARALMAKIVASRADVRFA
jgi:Family of unknown function (DUF6283)